MRTTPEVQMALRRKVRQETSALVVFHKKTFYLKTVNNTLQLALGWSISFTSHVYVPTAQPKLVIWRQQLQRLCLETCAVAHLTYPFLPLVCLFSGSIRGRL
ncbi:hypothetical protein AVEN_90849-1 [Araneus ventricosus]|uniref:Uncharacterized protein n=1 Tax=Araneus ventricosus TaxID=182803 RepID=A0A4Y2S955_ARAVE|nr:hypothetical protein AVEN_90849-1 [Araneus ventricosus]